MSHFTVLVIGDNIEKQLAPFHEFECTGLDDQYVQDIDETEEYRVEYETKSSSRIRCADGTILDDGDSKFYRDPTPEESAKIGEFGSMVKYASRDWHDGLGYRSKIWYLPDGCEEVEIPHKDLWSFEEFLSDYHEFPIITEIPTNHDKDTLYRYAIKNTDGNIIKVIRRTNPDAKWDWFVVGGRWTGFFKPKSGTSGSIGQSGSFGNLPEEGWVDSIRKGDIDFDWMYDSAILKATERYDAVHSVINGRRIESWMEVREKFADDIVRAREYYNNQEVMKDIYKSDNSLVRNASFDIDTYLVSREQYLDMARKTAISTFAVVKDGKWYERGGMGWFGIVTDEKTTDIWLEEFYTLLNNLPDDTLLTVVDCHI